jgi:hypothetical protein
MTRKDYVLIAAALKQSFSPIYQTSGGAQWEQCVYDISDVLEKDNSRFDRNRFLIACGLEVGHAA